MNAEAPKEKTSAEKVEDEVNRQKLQTPKTEAPKSAPEVPPAKTVTDPMPPAKNVSEEVAELFKRAKPVGDQEKLANLKETRAILGGTPVALAHSPHHLAAKRAPKPTPAPKPKPAPKKEVADEGGSAAAFDDLKELNTFSAQED